MLGSPSDTSSDSIWLTSVLADEENNAANDESIENSGVLQTLTNHGMNELSSSQLTVSDHCSAKESPELISSSSTEQSQETPALEHNSQIKETQESESVHSNNQRAKPVQQGRIIEKRCSFSPAPTQLQGPGVLANAYSSKWDGSFPELNNLYSQKHFLKAGFYSRQYKVDSWTPRSDRTGFMFLFPTEREDLFEEKEFFLPYDIVLFHELTRGAVGSTTTPLKKNSSQGNGSAKRSKDSQRRPKQESKRPRIMPDNVSQSSASEPKQALPKKLEKRCADLEDNAKPTPFEYIDENVYRKKCYIPRDSSPLLPCQCVMPKDPKEVACGEGCVNRALQVECGDDCPCLSRCSNRSFSTNAFVKPDQLSVKRTPGRGFGLFTETNIRAGALIIEYRGEVMSADDAEKLNETRYAKSRNHYVMHLHGATVVDATRKGTKARYANHSCGPNCHAEKWFVKGRYCIGIFASRDIQTGEEITYDYKFESASGALAQRCYCGAPTCRGGLGINDSEMTSEKAQGSKKIATKSQPRKETAKVVKKMKTA